MTLEPWKKISSEVLLENKFLKLRQDDFDLPNGVRANYYYLDVVNAVTIIAIDDEGKLVIVKQYRPLFDQIVSEFPAGGIKEGQTSDEAARDELLEEADVAAETLEYIGKFQSANARLNEWMHVFLAYGLSPAVGQRDETEEFEHARWTVEELEACIYSGEFVDGLCLATWTLARPRVMEIIARQND